MIWHDNYMIYIHDEEALSIRFLLVVVIVVVSAAFNATAALMRMWDVLCVWRRSSHLSQINDWSDDDDEFKYPECWSIAI